MNSSTIANLASGLKTHAEHSSAREADAANQDHSFADVLAGQAPDTPADSIRTNAATARTDADTDALNDTQAQAKQSPMQEADKPNNPHDAHAASLLPGIALEIASHARDQAAMRANRAPANAGNINSQTGLIDATAASAWARAGGLKNQPVAMNGGQPLSGQDTAAATMSADAHTKAAMPWLNGKPDPSAALISDKNTSLAGPAPTLARKATSAATQLSAFATRPATGKPADFGAGSSTAQDKAFDTASAANALVQAFDRPAFVSGTPAQAAAELSLAASGAAGNPFTLASTSTLGSGATAITTPVHQPGWGADFSRQVVTLAHNAHTGTQTAELRLDPPELGPLRISISLSEGMASALFVSSHASVRQAIESALPQLSQQLAQAGISLGDTQVGEHGQAGFAFQDDSAQAKGRSTHPNSATGAATLAESPPATRHTTASNSLVDTFA